MLLQIQDDIAPRETKHSPLGGVATIAAISRVSDLSRFLITLDEPSRSSLFGHVVSDAMLLRHAETAFEGASKVIGIIVEDELRGVLEAYSPPHIGCADVTLVVHQSWRRRGLGTALIEAAQKWASSKHLEALRIRFSPKNWSMRHLAQRANARLDIMLGEMCAEFAVRRSYQDYSFRRRQT